MNNYKTIEVYIDRENCKMIYSGTANAQEIDRFKHEHSGLVASVLANIPEAESITFSLKSNGLPKESGKEGKK